MHDRALAIVFTEDQTFFSATSLQKPRSNEGELLMKNDNATICTSYLRTFSGRRPSCSHIFLGNEDIKAIERTGPGGTMDYFMPLLLTSHPILVNGN